VNNLLIRHLIVTEVGVCNGEVQNPGVEPSIVANPIKAVDDETVVGRDKHITEQEHFDVAESEGHARAGHHMILN
jgi:hypothetical protein